MNSTEQIEIGTIDPSTDVKIGDLVKVRIAAAQVRDGAIYEIPVINTFRVESVDVLNETSLWCNGRVVETDYHTPTAFLGHGAIAYLGEV